MIMDKEIEEKVWANSEFGKIFPVIFMNIHETCIHTYFLLKQLLKI